MDPSSQPSTNTTPTTSTKTSSDSRRLLSNAHSTSKDRSSQKALSSLASLSNGHFSGDSLPSKIEKRNVSSSDHSSPIPSSAVDSDNSDGDAGVEKAANFSNNSPPSTPHSRSGTGYPASLSQRNKIGSASTPSATKVIKNSSLMHRDSRTLEKRRDSNQRGNEGSGNQREPPPLSSIPPNNTASGAPGSSTAPSTAAPLHCGCGNGIGKCPHRKCFDWRGTAEYRAAWDVEVWKAVQVERFRRQLEEHKAAALAELQRRVRKQEKIEVERLLEKQRQLELKEKGIRNEEQRQAQQRRRLEDAEKELTSSRQQLIEAQKRAEEEIRIQVRRVNEDYEHKSLRLRDQVTAAEAHSRRLEERLARSDADYLHLFEEFHRFRTEHVVHGTGMMGNSSGGLHYVLQPSGGNTLQDGQLNDNKLPAPLMVEMMRSRHSEELRALQERLEAKHENELRKLRQECVDLVEKNTQLTAALARRREQLRQFRDQQHLFQAGVGAQPPARNVLSSKPCATSETEKPMFGNNESKGITQTLSTELERLQRERHRLIYESGGALGDGDPVVDGISRRIAMLQTQIQLAVHNNN